MVSVKRLGIWSYLEGLCLRFLRGDGLEAVGPGGVAFLNGVGLVEVDV